MKISRSGSNSSWFSNHASRRSRMSGRSCSAAWADFFECQAAAVENGPDRAHARGDAALLREALLHLDKADVRGCFDEAEQEGAMGIKLQRRGWPCGRAVRSPLCRARPTQPMAVAIPTLTCTAARRAGRPASAASITRSRKSWL
jgi:hypothetical protein